MISAHDVWEPLKQALLASRDVRRFPMEPFLETLLVPISAY